MATRSKPRGVMRSVNKSVFKPRGSISLSRPSMPTSTRSVGSKIPSAPKPRSVAKAVRAKTVARMPVKSYTQPMAKMSGVIKGAKTLSRLASNIPGIGGLASRAVGAILPDGTPVFRNRKRRRGLTYSDIKGATRVLKLVKKFAPAGSRAKLRVKRSASY